MISSVSCCCTTSLALGCFERLSFVPGHADKPDATMAEDASDGGLECELSFRHVRDGESVPSASTGFKRGFIRANMLVCVCDGETIAAHCGVSGPTLW